uniref:Uncharacterized protein n=1 Tax=Anguilla anguilla TaxID=7936 RepID=A0A0E9SLU7_ANGAN
MPPQHAQNRFTLTCPKENKHTLGEEDRNKLTLLRQTGTRRAHGTVHQALAYVTKSDQPQH